MSPYHPFFLSLSLSLFLFISFWFPYMAVSCHTTSNWYPCSRGNKYIFQLKVLFLYTHFMCVCVCACSDCQCQQLYQPLVVSTGIWELHWQSFVAVCLQLAANADLEWQTASHLFAFTNICSWKTAGWRLQTQFEWYPIWRDSSRHKAADIHVVWMVPNLMLQHVAFASAYSKFCNCKNMRICHCKVSFVTATLPPILQLQTQTNCTLACQICTCIQMISKYNQPWCDP